MLRDRLDMHPAARRGLVRAAELSPSPLAKPLRGSGAIRYRATDEPSDPTNGRTPEMTMTNHDRAEWGRYACIAGDPDCATETEPQTSAVDTIANVLHFVAMTTDGDPLAALESARKHFVEEVAQWRPCPICGAEGPDESCIVDGELTDDHDERGA